MNRLIIVGNGFDRYHGLESDYRSFIVDYLYKGLKKFRDGNYSYDDELLHLEVVKDTTQMFFDRTSINESIPHDLSTKEVFDSLKLVKEARNIKLKFKSEFIKEICTDAELKWVDIERTYYKHLIKEFNLLPKGDVEEKDLSSIKTLNHQMKIIASELEAYLSKQAEERYKRSVVNTDDLYSPFMSREFDKDTWDKLTSNDDGYKTPEKVMVLNFNYTNPFIKDQLEDQRNNHIDIVNIHGRLNNKDYPIVFGYGDERDDSYKELEKVGEDELLKMIKSFSYFQNPLYGKLLGFIESGEFEVWIAGHSCGLSDKTLLAQIFEHDDCKNIKAFHYTDKDGKDNYNEIVYNIARVMEDKIKMRSIVTPKSRHNEFTCVANIIYGVGS